MLSRSARGRGAVAAAAMAPGALAGAHFAGLLFFLNPEVPFTWRLVLSGATRYAALGALASTILLLPGLWRRPKKALRQLPWTVTGAIALAALLAWSHASYYAYFLPAGINIRLIKAAIWLTLSALVGFYTALLHSLAKRPYGRRSRVAYWLLALASIYVTLERRDAFRPVSEPLGHVGLLESARRPQVVFVGLPTATLDAILPLSEQSSLPFLERMISSGASGHLASLTPHRSAALWTTVVTGKLPAKHGIVGRRIYPAPLLGPDVRLSLAPAFRPLRQWSILGGAGRPVDGRDLKAKPLWEIAARLGVKTAVIGWPMTYPVERELPYVVSDRYFSEPGAEDTIHPVELADRARWFELDPSALGVGTFATFGGVVPAATGSALLGDRWRQSLATYLLDPRHELGALFVYLPGLTEISRSHYGGYSAVQFEGERSAPYLRAAVQLKGYYREVDAMLQALWEARSGPTLFVLVSAYGVEPATGLRRIRAELSEKRSLRGYSFRSPDGVVLLYGAGIRAGGRLVGARLVDIVPTLLYALGFPIARDLDGQVLREAFTPALLERRPSTFVTSYEALENEALENSSVAGSQPADFGPR